MNLKNKVFMFNTKKNKNQLMMEDMNGNFAPEMDGNALTESKNESNSHKNAKN